MQRVLLITNPVSSRHDPNVVTIVTSTLDAMGISVDVAGTTRHGDAIRLAKQGVADGVDAIAVYGGDGTTMQAITGMIGSGLPLSLIPGGTGNLLAGNLRVPRNPAKAARLIAGGVRRPVDVGAIERPEGVRHFTVATGAGLDALVMKGATHQLKRRFGMAAYLISCAGLMSTLKAARYKVTVDGKTLEAEAITVVIANCAEVGPLFFQMGKEIRPDDGLLDILMFSARGIITSVFAGLELLWDRGGRGRIVRARGKSITIDADCPRPVQMDGELAGMTPLTAKVLPGAIEVLVPQRVSSLPGRDQPVHISGTSTPAKV